MAKRYFPSFQFVSGTAILIAMLAFISCKNKASTQPSARQGTWSATSQGVGVVASDSSATEGKSILRASIRDRAAVVAFCPESRENCSNREIPFVPGRVVASGNEGMTFASLAEFDLKATRRVTVFVRMTGGGLTCPEFQTNESAAGPVVVTTSGGPSLCNDADPAKIGNGHLREFLLATPANEKNRPEGPVGGAEKWVPNPEGFSLSEAERDLIERTNEMRATAGLPPLIVSGQLMTLARAWAQSVASRIVSNEHSASGVAENACCSPPGPFTGAAALGIWKYNVEASRHINSREARYIGVGSAMDAYGNYHWYQQFL